MVVHAEDADAIGHAVAPHGRRYADFLRPGPRGAENLAVARVVDAGPPHRRAGARAAPVLRRRPADARVGTRGTG